MNDLIEFDFGRVRAWFKYERWITDIDSIMKVLDSNPSINAVYNEEDCRVLVESIDNKYNSVDELIYIVNDAVSKVNGKINNA